MKDKTSWSCTQIPSNLHHQCYHLWDTVISTSSKVHFYPFMILNVVWLLTFSLLNQDLAPRAMFTVLFQTGLSVSSMWRTQIDSWLFSLHYALHLYQHKLPSLTLKAFASNSVLSYTNTAGLHFKTYFCLLLLHYPFTLN